MGVTFREPIEPHVVRPAMSRAPTSTSPETAKEIALFLLVTFGLTWGLQLPGVLAKEGLLPGGITPYLPFVMLGVLGPTAAAWILTRRVGGRQAARSLLQSVYKNPPSLPWLLFALVVPGLTLTIPLLFARLLGEPGPIGYPPKAASAIVVAVFISLGEEIGWRGYALPRLASRYGKVVGSALLGVIWALWHIPMFLGVDVPIHTFPLMLAYFVGASVVFSWLYFRTGGSLLVVVLAHVGAHLNNSHQTLPQDSTPLTLHAIGWTIAAVAVLLADRKTWRSSEAS